MKLFYKICSVIIVACFFAFSSLAQNTTGNWKIVGPVKFPTNSTGQMNGIARVSQMKFSATNANRAYAVSASGGLWISNDAGLNWIKTGTDNQLPVTACASVCVDYTNENIIYLSTGDANYYYNFYGIYKSTNGGVTWSPSNTGIGNRMAIEMLMDPTNHNTIIAATTDGIWKSLDAGVTWAVKKTGGAFRGMVYKPGSSSILYAVDSVRFWRSINNGDTWSQISSVNPAIGNGGSIAVSPANSNIVYVGFVGTNQGDLSKVPIIPAKGGVIYQSTDGGTTFTQRKGDVAPNLSGYDGESYGQGSYNWALGADRVNANILYAVGHSVWKSTNGGAAWTRLTDWPFKCHTDMHQIFVSPYNNNRLFDINDGGIFVSTDGGNNWTTSCDGLSATEFYHSGTSNLSKNIIGGGTQDNGGVYFNTNTWYTNRSGDWTAKYTFDYANPNTPYYIEWGEREDLLTHTTTSIGLSGPGNDDRYAMTKQNTNLAFAAQGTILRRTKNLLAAAPSWSAIKTFSAKIQAVTVSPNNTSEVYVVLDNQQVYFSSNATVANPTFTQVSTTPNATSSLANIAVNKANSSIVYVTCNSKIYRSTNKAISWTDITAGTAANTDIISLIHDPFSTNESFYMATAFGVYYKNSSLANWQSFSNGLPTIASITDLTGYFDGTTASGLRVSFYGRGLWESPIYSNGTNVVATGVSIIPPTASVGVGGTTPLAAAITPSNVSNSTVSWASSNNAIATVNASGLVTGIAIGSAIITVTTQSGNKTATANITVFLPNLALNKPAVSSSDQDGGVGAASAVDGSLGTRWGSIGAVDPQWIYVDLGATYNISRVKITWETALAANYLIQTSPDAVNWTTIKTVTGNTALVNDMTGLSGAGRYIRMYGTVRGTEYGYSIYELEVYGIASPSIFSNPKPLENTDQSSCVKIVPNPAKNEANIFIESKLDILASIEVADATGKVIMYRRQEIVKGSNKVNLNVSEFAAGTYYVLVKINEEVITKKMVVAK